MTMPLQDFEKSGALQILVYLYKNKDRKINISELHRNVEAHRETILTAVETLKKNKVAEDSVNHKFPFDHQVWLTTLGTEVASRISAIADAIDPTKEKRKGKGC